MHIIYTSTNMYHTLYPFIWHFIVDADYQMEMLYNKENTFATKCYKCKIDL